VADPPQARLDLGALLAASEDAAPVDAIDVLGDLLAEGMGAREVSLLLADFSGQALIRLGHTGAAAATRSQGRETGERVGLAGTPHERALTSQTVVEERGAGGTRLFAPVSNRGEAIGVLELRIDGLPGERTRAEVARAARALAYVVIANRRFTDLFEWGQRSIPLSLAAEIQHRLLPASYTCEAGQFTLAGWLEPAGEVGGDTFDFSLDRDTLHLSMTDAMGHEVGAALLATVLVGALRNGRRAGLGLAAQADRANAQLADHAPDGGFVTGQVVRIDLRGGRAMVVNAGHPPPLRFRAGRIEPVGLVADPPSGRCATTATASRRWSCCRVTGSCSSPTGCSTATRRSWTSGPCSAAPPACTPGRRSSTSSRRCSARPEARSTTTRRRSASTGTADRRAAGRPRRSPPRAGPPPATPRRPSRGWPRSPGG
jgi:hypothetical protein